MGNCLDSESAHDDISLLRESNNQTRDNSSDPLGPHSFHENAQNLPVYYPSPNVSRTAVQLTEEEQIKIAQRMGLIAQLPSGLYDGSKKNKECAICMGEFQLNEKVRFLPCMHIFHSECIDAWLMRSFICPSCLEPVDAALLSSYHQ